MKRNRLDLRIAGVNAVGVAALDAPLQADLGVRVRTRAGHLTKQTENCGNQNDAPAANCWDPIRAGVRIRWKSPTNAHICTMGFHIMKGGNEQWLTAGHCVKDSTTSVQMFHSKWFHNPGGQSPYQRVGSQQDSLYNGIDEIDAARIGNYYGSSEATARIYGTSQPYFTGGASSPVVGVKVWAKGATSWEQGFINGVSGGLIKSKSARWFSETKGITVKGATMGGFTSRDGDSGGPI